MVLLVVFNVPSQLNKMPSNVVYRKVGGAKRSRSSSVTRSSRVRASASSIPRTLKTICNQHHAVVMGTQQNFALNSSYGFVGTTTGNGMNLAFTQNEVKYSINAGAYQTLGTTFTNAASFATIYDQFRIDKVEVVFVFSSNTSTVNTLTQLPVMYCIVDYDSAESLSTTTQALAYSSCRVMQLGNSSGSNNGQQKMVCNKPGVRYSVDTTNAAVTTVTSSAIQRSPWLNTDSTIVEHNGIKLLLDQVTATNVVTGYLTVIVRQFMTYKSNK